MTIFILPTKGESKYAGKYPARARSISAAITGLHVELNDGTRLWTAKGAEHFADLPRVNADLSAIRARAIPMTGDQYIILLSAARLLGERNAARLPGTRARLDAAILRLVESIQPDAADAADAAAIDAAERDAAAIAAERDAAAEQGGPDAAAEQGGPDAALIVTPAWAKTLPMLRLLVERGGPDGARAAWEEIGRALALADERNAMAGALESLSICGHEMAEHVGEPGSMGRDELDSALARASELLESAGSKGQ